MCVLETKEACFIFIHTVIIDYGAGNLRSVYKAVERTCLDNNISSKISLTNDVHEVENADYIILPGVGSFEHCMAGLSAIPDMIPTLSRQVQERHRPFLGICVGMQMLAQKGCESGVKDTKGLGWIEGQIAPLSTQDMTVKVPHMGWNVVHRRDPARVHPILRRLQDGAYVYFAHSYHIVNSQDAEVLSCTYGSDIVAAVAFESIVGVQFHPEKSQKNGLNLLADFLQWKP